MRPSGSASLHQIISVESLQIEGALKKTFEENEKNEKNKKTFEENEKNEFSKETDSAELLRSNSAKRARRNRRRGGWDAEDPAPDSASAVALVCLGADHVVRIVDIV